jgi:hypothetical protein
MTKQRSTIEDFLNLLSRNDNIDFNAGWQSKINMPDNYTEKDYQTRLKQNLKLTQ